MEHNIAEEQKRLVAQMEENDSKIAVLRGEIDTLQDRLLNQIRTLRAKAALHDELVDALGRFVSGITNDRPDAGDKIHMALINGRATLAKCKAVK